MIISAAICDKSGDILVARQCAHITKHSLEESLRNFPSLIQADQQHTFVETEYVRYMYLPLEDMFLVLLTKKSSNIIEDQETIRLLHKIVQELCTASAGISQEAILEHDFEILLSFDDVVSQGMRESVTLTQVQTSLSMESEDERLHIILMKQKQAEQNEAIKRHQQEMEQKRKAGKPTGGNSISSSSYGSYGSSSSNIASSTSAADSSFAYKSSSKLISDDNEGVYQANDKPVYTKPSNSSKPTTTAPKSGMVLGKKSKVTQQKEAQATLKDEIAASLKAGTNAPAKSGQHESSSQSGIPAAAINPLKTPIEIEIVEKISAIVERDGSAKSLDVNGDVFLQFFDAAKTRVALQFDYETLPGLTMKPHINLNKQLWTDKKQIVLKNIESNFPVNTRVPSVKYRYASTAPAKDLPFNLTCWFNDGNVAIEVEFNEDQQRIKELNELTLTFTYPRNESPDVSSVENATFETSAGQLRYVIPKLSAAVSTSTIQIGFSANLQEEQLLPIQVDFELAHSFIEIGALMAANLAEGNASVKFDTTKKCSADKFQIV